MQFVRLTGTDGEALLERLASMPRFLRRAFEGLASDDATMRPAADAFAPVEQCWHLADLEREGFAVRIRRLLSETDPVLPDFDGARVAEERQYLRLPMAEALDAFEAARRANVQALRAIAPEDWSRSGIHEGVGPLMLCDVPIKMAEHDASHRLEIEAWLRSRGGR